MAKVYLVCQWGFDEYEIVRAFSTRLGATACVLKLEKERSARCNNPLRYPQFFVLSRDLEYEEDVTGARLRAHHDGGL